MKYINTLANTINNANINSCETAAGLVGTVWPKTHVAQQQVCQDIGYSQGMFTDWADARQGCSNGGDMTKTLNDAKMIPIIRACCWPVVILPGRHCKKMHF